MEYKHRKSEEIESLMNRMKLFAEDQNMMASNVKQMYDDEAAIKAEFDAESRIRTPPLLRRQLQMLVNDNRFTWCSKS